MALTGRLGTSDSRPGNIILGADSGTGGGGGGGSEDVSIDSIASIANVARLNGLQFLTIASHGTFSAVISQGQAAGLLIAASAAFTGLGGYRYLIFFPIDALTTISPVAGLRYTSTLTVSAVASFDKSFDYIQQETVVLAVTNTVAIGVIENTTASLNIRGIASFAPITTGSWVQSVSIGAKGQIFAEQKYDVLFVTAVTAGFVLTAEQLNNSNEVQSARGTISLQSQAIFSRSVSHTLSLVQNVKIKKTISTTAQILTLTQTVSCKRVRQAIVSQTLSFVQKPDWSRVIVQSLHLTQSVSAIRLRSRPVSDILALTQTISVGKILNRTVHHTLIFNVPLQKQTAIISGGTPFTYYPPLIDYVLIPRKCVVIISVPTQSVVLPCPIFGDSQAYQGEVAIKRTMVGGTRTYVKQTQLQQIEYKFDIWTQKYQELAYFIQNHSHKIIRLDNWKGESWAVNIMNNPVEFSADARYQPKGERYSVTLQFQGIKIR